MPQSINEEEVLNFATRIAVQAKIDGVERSQIENLLASLELAADPKNSLWVSTLYAYRQAERGRIGRRTAELIYEAMSRLYEAGCGKDEARKLLGFAKWVYESLEKRSIPRIDARRLTLQELLKMLKGG